MTDATQPAVERANAPDPDDSRKPDSPWGLNAGSWKHVARTTVRQFQRDECLDLGAALTYYAVLSAAPALLALLSIIGLVGDPERTVDQVLNTFSGMMPAETLKIVEPLVEDLAGGGGRAGWTLVLGIVLAFWSASGYVGAFGRAMNRVYGIDEGRPIWKLRPLLLLVTVVLVVVAALVAAALVLSGPVARAIGDAVGFGATAVTVWSIVKWPVVILLVIAIIAILYHTTPNVQQPRFRWLSPGAVVALLVWVIASVGFAFYAANFSNYQATYGALAGVIVMLLWLWITNLALLFGAELDAEVERSRQLQGGIAAEETIQLPPRDTRASEKREAKRREDIERGRELRREAEREAASGGRRNARDRADM